MTHSNLIPSRYPSRMTQDFDAICQVLDEVLYCTIAFNVEKNVHQIPTGFCRINDKIFIHGSSKSHFLASILNKTVSFALTLLDGLVLAPTAFDHSFNYRSVVGSAKAEAVEEKDLKWKILEVFMNKYIPGRAQDLPPPTEDQLKVTQILSLDLHHAALKKRAGEVGVQNIEKFNKWAGIVPILPTQYGNPIPDPSIKETIPLPNYLQKW